MSVLKPGRVRSHSRGNELMNSKRSHSMIGVEQFLIDLDEDTNDGQGDLQQ